MKRKVLFAVLIVVVAGVIAAGPTLLDIYRLQAYISASTENYHAQKGPWPAKVDACESCHGERGSSLHRAYPSLAGQPAAYLSAQLRQFASGQRHNSAMSPLAQTMDGAEIQTYADYFSAQEPRGNPFFTPNEQHLVQGEALASSAGCAGCHGEGMMGQGVYPRLAGQGYDYLLNQLNAYRSGARQDPNGIMNGLVAGYSIEEHKALATYLASLSVGSI